VDVGQNAQPVPEDANHLDYPQQRLRSPDRVVALSDGVFAIVITILVLEIAVPPNLSTDSLQEVLEQLRPTLQAWVVSFLITGMYWIAHRDLFARVRFVNRDLVWLNLLFLLPASLIPFAASVLGQYPNEPLAIDIYGAVMILVSVMRLVVYWYVVRRPHLLWPGDVAGRSWIGYGLVASPIVVYAIAMAIAATSPTASIILFFAVSVLYFLLITVLRKGQGTRAHADDFS
jgi:uncharacterized membrane protein